jgi:hypothetical protein
VDVHYEKKFLQSSNLRAKMNITSVETIVSAEAASANRISTWIKSCYKSDNFANCGSVFQLNYFSYVRTDFRSIERNSDKIMKIMEQR